MQTNKKYYNCADIMEMCNVSRSRAYAIIRQMNDELRDEGYIIPKLGQVPRTRADKRLKVVE